MNARLFLFPFLLFLLGGQTGFALGAAPKITDPKDRKIVAAFLKHSENVPNQISVAYCKGMLKKNTEGYTWLILPRLGMIPTAFRLSGDAKYLDVFVRTVVNMRTAMSKGSDGFLGWYGVPEPGYGDPKLGRLSIDYEINAFRFIEMLCLFLENIQEDPELAKQYAAQRREYLDLIENHLVKKWDARRLYVDLGSGGAIYRARPELERFPYPCTVYPQWWK